MARARKPWAELSTETQERYMRAGLTETRYEAGAPLPMTRGPAKSSVSSRGRRKTGLRKDTDGGSGRA